MAKKRTPSGRSRAAKPRPDKARSPKTRPTPTRLERPPADVDEVLHAAAMESLEKRIMDLALERTGARHGAIFLADESEDTLVVDFHVVDGLAINLPNLHLKRRRDGRPNGVAFWVYDHNQPYLCPDTTRDPNYASYFLDVRAIAAVPIVYQQRAIGVLSVSSTEPDALSQDHLDALAALSASSTKFLRRAQLYRAQNQASGRVLLIKGLSPQWLAVERQIEQAAPTNAPVLVQGESGTGKELVANALHFNSRRAKKPFVVVNCAAIPEQLLESVLFGHVKGAFTGASFHKIGEFQKAEGGTLFLDEVGDLPTALQPKVLRAIEQGEVQPLGSNDPPARVDVRLVCATNRDLAAMVNDGTFREDLYFRISLITMRLPPLRDYKNNLSVLTQVFLMQAARRHGKQLARFSAEADALLQAYAFPGNMRELKNIVEHAVIMATGPEIVPADLPGTVHAGHGDAQAGAVAPAPPPAKTLKELRERWLAPLETRYLTELLDQCGGNVREAAKRAGVNTVTLYRLLKKRGLKLTRAVTDAGANEYRG